ncbi:hypothetical protein GJ633_06950, partial [Halorubrum sp. CBA1125]|uniref:hypothetical protein n=1 Tax=Halorubrum sp. CBA1125 TaxID=2668072 RepID=UPI00135DD323|nr:hypothetical protein [Halorubrum sp. CBA1125]
MGSEPTARGDRFADRLADRLFGERVSLVGGTAAVAALAVAGRTALTIATNAPFEPVSVPTPLRWLAAIATPLALSASAGAAALAADRPSVASGSCSSPPSCPSRRWRRQPRSRRPSASPPAGPWLS